MVERLMQWYNKPSEYIPSAPPLPKYDPQEDAPRWTYRSLWFFDHYTSTRKPDNCPPIGIQPASDNDPDWRGVIKSRVNVIPLPEEDRICQEVPRYFWFDTPDWADPFEKLKWLARSGLLLSYSCAGLRGILLADQPKLSLLGQFIKATKFAMPLYCTIMMTGLTVITVANVRGKKDDLYNYFAGAVAGTCLYGNMFPYRNNIFKAFVIYTPFVLLLKYNAETNGMLNMRLNPRAIRNLNLLNPTGEDGMANFDFRFGIVKPDPGRDTRF